MAKTSKSKNVSKKSTTPATETTPATTKKGQATATKEKTEKAKSTQHGEYKRGSLGKAIMAYFDAQHKAKKDFSYEDALALAQKEMPETKFNKSHYAWYKNKWKQNNM